MNCVSFLQATDYPVSLERDAIQSNIAKAERLEQTLVKEKQLEIEQIRNKALPLMSEPSIVGTSDIVISQKTLETNWEELKSAALAVKKRNESARQLLEGKGFKKR